MSVLVIAEPNSKEVDRGTLSAITAAQIISDNISLLVLDDSEEVLKNYQNIKGVTNIIAAKGALEGGLA